MLVSHKEYGRLVKNPPRAMAEGLLKKKESGKKDETVILFQVSGSDPGTSVWSSEDDAWGCMDVNF